MSAAPLDPIVSEFATQLDAEAYDTWFRAKVAASLDDPRPSIPHDEAMARVDGRLAHKVKAARCFPCDGAPTPSMISTRS